MPLLAWPLLVVVVAYLCWQFATGDVAEDASETRDYSIDGGWD